MQQIHELVKANLTEAQVYQEEYANRTRQPAPNYQPGDLVWLVAKNIRTERPSKKLDWKQIGPYKVLAKISPYAYKLDLPPTIRIHPVFHVSLLLPTATDPYTGQYQDPPPPVIVNDHEEYEVEAILASKRVRNRNKYLVKWTGYDQPTWEPHEYVKHLQAFKDYQKEKEKEPSL